MGEKAELEGLKEEMLKIADHLEDHEEELTDEVTIETTYGILRSLLQGATAATIIEGYGLEAEEETGV